MFSSIVFWRRVSDAFANPLTHTLVLFCTWPRIFVSRKVCLYLFGVVVRLHFASDVFVCARFVLWSMVLCCGHECEFGHSCARVSCDDCVSVCVFDSLAAPQANEVECMRKTLKNSKDKYHSKNFFFSILFS